MPVWLRASSRWRSRRRWLRLPHRRRGLRGEPRESVLWEGDRALVAHAPVRGALRVEQAADAVVAGGPAVQSHAAGAVDVLGEELQHPVLRVPARESGADD